MDETTSYHHGALRKTLIEAGVAILKDEDVSALTLRRVARIAQVSHMAPYRHFTDKNALLAAIAVEGFQMLASDMHHVMQSNVENPRHVIKDIGVSYVRFGIEHPAHISLMFSGLLATSENEELNAAAAQTLNLLIEAVEHAQSHKVIAQGESKQIAKSVWGLFHGLTMLMKEGLLISDVNNELEVMVSAAAEDLLRGLANCK